MTVTTPSQDRLLGCPLLILLLASASYIVIQVLDFTLESIFTDHMVADLYACADWLKVHVARTLQNPVLIIKTKKHLQCERC